MKTKIHNLQGPKTYLSLYKINHMQINTQNIIDGMIAQNFACKGKAIHHNVPKKKY